MTNMKEHPNAVKSLDEVSSIQQGRHSLRRIVRNTGIALVVAVWLVAVGAGMRSLARYENTPGQSASPPIAWPDNSRLQRNAAGATLVVLAHPQCPCTRTTIGELELIIARSGNKLRTYVLFMQPDQFDREWVQTDLWKKAEAIPGVSVIADSSGLEARIFGARTSGQALLYDKAGGLRFHGGITPSRGHSGDNVGRSTIVTILNEPDNFEADMCSRCFVFGCPLFNQSVSD